MTECVTGLDLVELMIRVAAGETLPLGQEDVRLQGWAIEARVYAEDPARGFLPSIGRLTRYRAPLASRACASIPACYEGGEISMFYDPMIAKLVGFGADRDEAIDRACARRSTPTRARRQAQHRLPRGAHGASALPRGAAHDRIHRRGIPARLPRPRAAMRRRARASWPPRRRCSAARRGRGGHGASSPVTKDVPSRASRARWTVATMRFSMRRRRRRLRAVDRGESGATRDDRLAAGQAARSRRRRRRRRHGPDRPRRRPVAAHPCAAAVSMSQVLRAARRRAGGADAGEAAAGHLQIPALADAGPAQGVAVKEGQEVKAGEELCVVEAMKMENILRAERDGTVPSFMPRPATASRSTSASWSSAEARRIVRSPRCGPRTPGPEAVAGARRLVLARPRHQCRAPRPRPRRPLRHAVGGARNAVLRGRMGVGGHRGVDPGRSRAARDGPCTGGARRGVGEPDADWLRERRNALVHVGPDRAANDVPDEAALEAMAQGAVRVAFKTLFAAGWR